MPVKNAMSPRDRVELLMDQIGNIDEMPIQQIRVINSDQRKIFTNFLLVGTFLGLMLPFFRAANNNSTGAIQIRGLYFNLEYLHAA